MQVVYVARVLKVDQIPQVAGEVVDAIFGAARRLGVAPDGPLIFIYLGMTSLDTEFTLEFALPVSGSPTAFTDPESGCAVRTTEPFRCATRQHLGSMATIIETWTALYGAVAEGGYALTPEAREVYTSFVAFDSAENITEIQIGIQ